MGLRLCCCELVAFVMVLRRSTMHVIMKQRKGGRLVYVKFCLQQGMLAAEDERQRMEGSFTAVEQKSFVAEFRVLY